MKHIRSDSRGIKIDRDAGPVNVRVLRKFLVFVFEMAARAGFVFTSSTGTPLAEIVFVKTSFHELPSESRAEASTVASYKEKEK